MIVFFNLILLINAYAADDRYITAESPTKRIKRSHIFSEGLLQPIPFFEAASSVPTHTAPAPKLRQSPTPLHIAVSDHDLPKLRELLKTGADVCALNPQGATPIHLAAREGNTPALKLLLAHKDALQCLSIQDYKGKSPLHYAAANKSCAIEMLVRKLPGDSTEILELRDLQGSTALAWAASSGRYPSVKALVEKGANVNARNDFKGRTALHWVLRMRQGATKKYAAQMSSGTARRILGILTQYNADPDIQDNSGLTPIDWAKIHNLESEKSILMRRRSKRIQESQAEKHFSKRR